MKKIISLLMAFVMLFSVTSGLTLTAYAETPTSGQCGENAFWNYDEESKTLTISGTGKMFDYNNNTIRDLNNKPVKALGYYDLLYKVSTIKIIEGITLIGARAFYECSGLKSITIPNSVTLIRTEAFCGCKSLENVFYEGYKTNWKKINIWENNEPLLNANIICKELKDKCSGICNDNLSWQYDPSTKTMIFNGKGELFFDKGGDYCGVPLPWQNTVDDDDIEKIVISNGITYVNFSSFSDCSNIKEAYLGKDVKNFESVNSAFFDRDFYPNYKNFSLFEKINIDPNNIYMTSIDGVVYNKNKTILICYPCGRKAAEYKILDGVKSIEPNCFSYSTNLKKISISDSVKTIGYSAFSNSGIVDLVIQDSVNLIENHAFFNCKNLKTIKIGNGVSEISDFSGCDNLEFIELGNNVEYIGGEYGESLKTIVLPKSLKQIGSNTFKNCYNLKDVYYSGNEKNWYKIKIGSGNYGLFTAQIHYNSTPTKQPDVNPTPGGSTGGGSTAPAPAPGGSIGGGFAPAPTPEDTDKKDEDQKPETKPAQTTTPTDTTEKSASVKVNKTLAKKKALVVYWNKIADASGYQIQIATDKKFKKNKKTITVAKQNASKKTVKKLKAKKKYFVRVRAYKIVDGKKVYGKWSKIKSVKTK